jgi:disease resistance protein RPS2
MQLHVIFPREYKLQNLKILRLSDCKTNEVLFSASVAQSLQQLEELRICGCNELKHIISASEEIIPTPLNSHFLMNNLRDVDISYCQSLESIFPICYVKGLTLLKQLFISYSPNLKFVFGECDYKSLSLHQYKNQVMLPHLEHLNLLSLDNLIGMCLENCQAQWPSQSMKVISIQGCPKLAKPWFSLKVGHDQKRYRPIEVSTLIEML